MSLFDFPRIHVWGRCVTNPGTGNNDSASPGTELSVVSNTERVRAMTQGKADDEFHQWMIGLDQYGLLRCQWNYYGDFQFRFTDVRVQSVQLAAGSIVSDKSQDPVIGAQLYLNDMLMCDTNPEGFTSTQIFAESLELRAPGALGGTGTFLSRKPTRATTRWLNWYRNVSYHGLFGLPPTGANGKLSSGGAGGASATFQCGIEIRPADLAAPDRSTADNDEVLHKFLPAGSPALEAMAALIRDGRARGLVFRYTTYLCFPNYSDTDLAVAFAAGKKLPNPAYGLVLGTLAPWGPEEPSTITMGRHLKPIAPFANPYRDKPYYISPIVAGVDTAAKRLTLDTANSLPEDGPDGDKFNLGTVTVGLRAATPPGVDPATNQSPITPIGTLQNDRQTYIAQGGLYDLSYASMPPAQQALIENDGYELVLQTGLCGVLMSETPYMMASDCGCNYLDELPPGGQWNDPAVRAHLAAQPFPALRGDVDLFLWRRGKPVTGSTPVRIEQWKETPTGYINEYGVYRYPTLVSTDTITMDGPNGTYRLTPVEGSGLRLFRFVPPENFPQDIAPPTLANLAFQEFFVELRVLPFDDYSTLKDEEVTFDLIYDEIFRYYHLILPAMSQRLDMSDPTVWQSPTAARYILRMIETPLWGYYNYMPRTRDLSEPRRQLLRRYCRKVIAATEQHGPRNNTVQHAPRNNTVQHAPRNNTVQHG